jgi:hypothetical protein
MTITARIVMVLVCALPVVLLTVDSGNDEPPPLVLGHGTDRFLDESFTDWVSFADQLSVVTVVAEQEQPREPGVIAHGEGYISRIVTLRVERTLWNRRGAPSVAGTFDVITDGWVVAEGVSYAFALEGGPRLEVGGRYVTPLVRAPRDGVEWTPLSAGSTLALESDRVSVDDVAGVPETLANALEGRSPDYLASILSWTIPNPVAAVNFGLSPDARMNAVVGG